MKLLNAELLNVNHSRGGTGGGKRLLRKAFSRDYTRDGEDASRDVVKSARGHVRRLIATVYLLSLSLTSRSVAAVGIIPFICTSGFQSRSFAMTSRLLTAAFHFRSKLGKFIIYLLEKIKIMR